MRKSLASRCSDSFRQVSAPTLGERVSVLERVCSLGAAALGPANRQRTWVLLSPLAGDRVLRHVRTPLHLGAMRFHSSGLGLNYS